MYGLEQTNRQTDRRRHSEKGTDGLVGQAHILTQDCRAPGGRTCDKENEIARQRNKQAGTRPPYKPRGISNAPNFTLEVNVEEEK